MKLRVVLLAACLLGCSDVERNLQVVPVLPSCVPTDINSVQLLSLGDFPPAPAHTAATNPGAMTSLSLPAGTRVLEVDGLGPMGRLVAFGRTAPFNLSDLSPRVALNYGAPDSLCATAGLSYSRAGHQATLLHSGAVLFSGGHDDSGFAVLKLELYIPFGDALSPPGSFRTVDREGRTTLDSRAALGHAVAVLAGGDILITGGAPSSGGKPAGIAYQGFTHHTADGVLIGDPGLLSGVGRAFHSATVLADGRVILIGGCARFDSTGCASDSLLASSVLYNQGVWSDGPSLQHARLGHQAQLLADGRILITGGGPVELFDPLSGGTDAGSLPGIGALLPSGAAISVEGSDAALWLDGQSLPLSPPPTPRSGHTLSVLEDGTTLVAGGGDSALLLYDPLLGPRVVPGPFARHEHTATRLGDGSVLLAGGTEAGSKASIFLHSPLGPFSNLPTLTFEGTGAPLVPRRPDHVRVLGGQLEVTADAPLSDKRPAELALLGALDLGDLQLAVTAGADSGGGAALILGWRSDARYAFVSLRVGEKVTLSLVEDGVVRVACADGVVLEAGELPDFTQPAGLAAITLNWRSGHFEVFTAGRSLLQCTPEGLARGAVGVGALSGRARFDDLSLTR